MKKKGIFDDIINPKKIKKAASGTYMNLKTLPDEYYQQFTPDEPELKASTRMQQTTLHEQDGHPNTDIAENAAVREGRQPGTAAQVGPTSKPMGAGGGGMGPYSGQAAVNMGEIIGGALGIFNQLLPDDDERPRLLPQQVYNQNPYGTGSQALMRNGGTVLADGDTIGDPDPKKPTRDPYYESSARLAYFKGALNNKLKAKNPEGFDKFFGGLKDIRMKGDQTGAQKYVQETPYDDYLTPEEVQSTLGDDYPAYLESLKTVNTYNVSQGQQPLYGTTEGDNDVTKLNYGRRFASLQVTPSVGHSVTSSNGNVKRYNRNYSYDPVAKKVNYTETGDLSIRPSYLAPPSPPTSQPLASLKNGGTLGATQDPRIITTGGGKAMQASLNPYDGGTIKFTGDSHNKGGIGLNFDGKQVEVEGNEYASQDPQGNLHVFGNMNVPGTNTKFKTVLGEMAEKEKRYDFLKTRGAELVNNVDPVNKFDTLTFNSGQVMMEGGDLGQQDLSQKKQRLGALQKAMLDTAQEHNLDPQALSEGRTKKAKKGTFLKAAPGTFLESDPEEPTMADRNNNPGNIKWGNWAKKFGGIKGPAATDGGNFAIFPDRESGFKAMKGLLKTKNYKDLPVQGAINRWTNNSPYSYDLGSLATKKVADLSDQEFQTVIDTMTRGEGTKYGVKRAQMPTRAAISTTPTVQAPPAPAYTPFGLPQTNLSPVQDVLTPVGVEPPALGRIDVPQRGPIPSNVERLDYKQLLGEIYAFATNDQEPVQAQEYQPLLKNPFQVSFQDRINENQSTFNALQSTLGQNPEALSTLSGQLYRANNAVAADEFRTNQGISNSIANENIGILNDAQLKNLSIRDQQAVRQSTAKSKTKAQNQMIFNSLSTKFMQNEFENKRLAAYENLYDFRFDPTADGGLQATHYGPNAMFNYDGPSIQAQNSDEIKTVTRYDANGNLKGTTKTDESNLLDEKRRLEIENQRRKTPLISIRRLFEQ